MNRLFRCARISLFVTLLVPGWAWADWYVGAAGGRTNNEYLPTYDPAAGQSIDDQDTAVKMTVGVDLSPNLAVEFDYADLNSLVVATAPGQSTEVKANALGLTFVASTPVYTNTRMYARFGIGRWDSDLTVNGVSASGSGVDPLIGLGIAYRLESVPLSLQLEWSQYQNVGQGVATTSTRLTGQNVDVLWLGIVYRIKLAPGP